MRNMIQIHLERSKAAVSNLEVTLTIGYCAHRLLRNPFACHRLEPWNSKESHDPLGLVVASGKAYLTQWDLPCESSPALCTQQSAICFQVFFFFTFHFSFPAPLHLCSSILQLTILCFLTFGLLAGIYATFTSDLEQGLSIEVTVIVRDISNFGHERSYYHSIYYKISIFLKKHSIVFISQYTERKAWQDCLDRWPSDFQLCPRGLWSASLEVE